MLKAGVGAAGLALTSGVWSPALAKPASSAPRPIPGVVFPGTPFHIEIPQRGNELSAITDFNGVLGAAVIDGAGDAWEPGSTTSHRLVFDVDMRFMSGLYVGVDGRNQQGTFAFTWLDLYEGQVDPNTQVHDLEPGIDPYPDGLFWISRVDPSAVSVRPGSGDATLAVTDLDLKDYGDFNNALNDGPSVAATATYRVEWVGGSEHQHLRVATEGFVGTFVEGTATIAWSAQNATGFRFVSDPANTSTSFFAAVGKERNGAFFS